MLPGFGTLVPKNCDLRIKTLIYVHHSLKWTFFPCSRWDRSTWLPPKANASRCRFNWSVKKIFKQFFFYRVRQKNLPTQIRKNPKDDLPQAYYLSGLEMHLWLLSCTHTYMRAYGVGCTLTLISYVTLNISKGCWNASRYSQVTGWRYFKVYVGALVKSRDASNCWT